MGDKQTDEQVIATLNARAKDLGDSFRVKVMRRPSSGALPQHIATLDAATVGQISSPEEWLPKLCGGGLYTLTCYHSSEITTSIGVLSFSFANIEVREITPAAMRMAGWKGPTLLIYPEVLQGDPTPSHVSIPLSAPAGSLPQQYVPVPAAQPWAPLPQASPAQQAELQAERERLASTQRALDEQRHRMELDQIRRDNDEKLRNLEARIQEDARRAAMQVAATAQPAPAKSSLTEIAGVVTSLATSLVMPFLQSQAEQRKEQARLDQMRHDENQKLMLQLMAKPQTDPTTEKLLARLDKLQDKLTEQNPSSTAVAETMHSLVKTTTGMMRLAAEMTTGGPEPKKDHPVLLAIREGIAAVSAIAEKSAGPAPQRRALPAPVPVQQPPQFQQQPQNVPQQGQPPPTGTPSPVNVADQIEAMVKSKADPVVVVDYLLAALQRQDPGFVAELTACDGDPQELFARRCGAWVMSSTENQAYAEQVLKTLEIRGTAAGIFSEVVEDGAEPGASAQA